MHYCQHCAGPIEERIPQGDNRLRFYCAQCEVVFYQNPNNIVGTLPVYGTAVLLCKRAIEPRLGKWTLPAGFMENGETTLQGAIRETQEEAGALLQEQDCNLYTLFNLPNINQVHFFFLTTLPNMEFSPGQESLEVALFEEHEIPWDELAFAVIKTTLQQYFEDRKKGQFPVRMFDIHYSPARKLSTQLISDSHHKSSETD